METRLQEIRNQTAELLSEALGLIHTIRPDVLRVEVSNRGGIYVWAKDFKSGYHPRSILDACDNLPTPELIRDTRIKQLKSEIKQLENES
jgi:hypothetical protein